MMAGGQPRDGLARKSPLVSVLIASYNPGRYLRAAIESVLGQTYDNIELILIDDGSTDQSLDQVRDLLEDPKVRLLTQRNAGKSIALNQALDIASGEFYAIQDADDISHPTRIERQVETMLSEPDVACVMCGHDLIIGDDEVAPTAIFKNRDQCRSDIESFRMPAHDPTAMFRRSLVMEMRYDSELRVAQGYDYILRVGERFPMMVLGECLYSYRVHRTSITKRVPEERQRFVKSVQKQACLRRGGRYEDVFREVQHEPQYRRNRDLDNNLAAHFIKSAVDLRARGRRLDAIKTGLYCAQLHPFDPHYYKALAYVLLPLSVVVRVRAMRKNVSMPIAQTDIEWQEAETRHTASNNGVT